MAYSPVYSTRFIAGQTNGTPVPAGFVVPAGMVAVVTCVDIVNAAAGAGVGGFVEPGVVYMGYWTLTGVGAQYQWRGRAVFVAGQEINCAWSSGTWYYAVNGYLLVN